MRFTFEARHMVLPGEGMFSNRKFVRDMAFAGATEKAILVLKNQRVVKERALTTDDLKQYLSIYFPPTLDWLKEHELGGNKVFVARALVVVDIKEFRETLRLWNAYKLKGKVIPARIMKTLVPAAMANGTMPDQTANGTEKTVPVDPLDLPAEAADFYKGASLPSLIPGSESDSPFAPADMQPVEYLTTSDLLIKVTDLWTPDKFTDPEQALELARLALIREPTNHIAANNMGVAFYTLGKYEQAMASYNKAIALQENFLEAFHNRAQVHYLHGDYGLAIKDYSKVLEINSEYISARTHRALAYGKIGNAGLMCSDLEVACHLGHCSFHEAAQRLGDCP